jgi:hypothetical protein
MMKQIKLILIVVTFSLTGSVIDRNKRILIKGTGKKADP